MGLGGSGAGGGWGALLCRGENGRRATGKRRHPPCRLYRRCSYGNPPDHVKFRVWRLKCSPFSEYFMTLDGEPRPRGVLHYDCVVPRVTATGYGAAPRSSVWKRPGARRRRLKWPNQRRLVFNYESSLTRCTLSKRGLLEFYRHFLIDLMTLLPSCARTW